MPSRSKLERHLSAIEQHAFDAVMDPLRWGHVGDSIQHAIGASAVSLAIRNKHSWEVVDPIVATWDETATAEYLTYFHAEDVVSPRLARVTANSPFDIEELIDIRAFARTAFFNDWANRYSVAFLTGMVFDLGDEHVGVLSIHRSTSTENLGPLEREFIRRASSPLRFALRQRKISQKLQLAEGSLDRFSIGIAHLDERGRIIWCNTRAVEILRRRDGLTVKGQKLRAVRPDAASKLDAAIQDTLQGASRPCGVDLMIPRSSGAMPLHVVVVPSTREYSASLWGAYVPTTIFIHDMEDQDSHWGILMRMFQMVFKLTALQAEIACNLVHGARYKDLVTPQRKHETVRSHIKAIYAKTNVRGRAELQKLAQQMVMQLRSKEPGKQSLR